MLNFDDAFRIAVQSVRFDRYTFNASELYDRRISLELEKGDDTEVVIERIGRALESGNYSLDFNRLQPISLDWTFGELANAILMSALPGHEDFPDEVALPGKEDFPDDEAPLPGKEDYSDE
jgi:hypothetical protein